MNGARLGRVSIIFGFFALLSLSAWTDFPENYFDEPVPRGVSALQAIVSAFGTRPFGNVGGAIFFCLIGVIVAWLAYRQVDADDSRSLKRPDQKTSRGSAAQRSAFSHKPAIGASSQTSIAQSIFDSDEMLTVASPRRDAEPVPAWAILLRSPYKLWADATSWLGGQPKAPPGFVWPRETDGTPQTFLAQIDLGSLKPDPEVGGHHFNLPHSGALLIFVGKG